MSQKRKKCRICGKKLILTGIADGVLCPDCRYTQRKSTIDGRKQVK